MIRSPHDIAIDQCNTLADESLTQLGKAVALLRLANEMIDYWMDRALTAQEDANIAADKLAALEARRCDGCAHGDAVGEREDAIACRRYGIVIAAGHYCAAWEALPPFQGVLPPAELPPRASAGA